MADHQLEIDPSKYQKDFTYIALLVIFWLGIATAPMLFAAKFFFEPHLFLFILIPCAYIASFGIAYIVWASNRKETLRVDGDTLVVKGTGLSPNSSVVVPKKDLESITHERYVDDFDETESVYSLNLFYKHNNRSCRIILAPLVSPKDKVEILNQMQSFLRENGFEFETHNTMLSAQSNCNTSKPPCDTKTH